MKKFANIKTNAAKIAELEKKLEQNRKEIEKLKMLDMNGKEIKEGVCLEIIYNDDGDGKGLGQIVEKYGELGFIEYDYFSGIEKFYALSEIDQRCIKGFLIIKE